MDNSQRLDKFRREHPGVLTDSCLREEYYSILLNKPYIPSNYCQMLLERTKWVKKPPTKG